MPATVEENGIPYISPVNFTNDGKIDFDNAKKISINDFLNLSKKCKPEKNDIIFPRYGTIGVIRMVETDQPFIVSYSCCTIKNLHHFICPKYVFYVLQSKMIKDEINRYINKTTQPNVGLKSIKIFLFPLPPLAEQKRIVEKIEQILPHIDQYEKAWGKLETFNKRFPDDMKKSLLQYAIEGKLVEQRPEEGTAEELYQQIQEEKQRLIAEKKIKKEKQLPEITQDEIPFDIPDSWKWVRLRDICIKIVDGDHNPPSGVDFNTNFIMLSAQNINNDKIVNLDQVRYLTEDVFNIANQRTNVNIGDIFFTIVGTLGRSCVYNGGYNICFQRSVSVLQTLIYNYFLKYTLDTPFIQQFMIKNATGTAQKGFYLRQLEKLVIPLPPLAEQKRIVEKLEQMLPLCERLK